MFEEAIINKYRYDSAKGKLTTEDLPDLPLTSLDDIAIKLDDELENHTKSFITKVSKKDSLIKKKLDIVKYFIKLKLKEQEEAEKAAQLAEERQRIMEIIDEKRDDDLRSKSMTELKKLLKKHQ